MRARTPQVKSEDDWMAKYFFSGGTMPSHDLLLFFQQHLALQSLWWVNGTHYSRTLEAWLRNQDRERRAVLAIFERTYGRGQAVKWFVYWRLFYLACSELFNFNGGEEWGVGLYLFQKPAAGEGAPPRVAAAAAAAPAKATKPAAAKAAAAQ
jgi:cyclopropane-fatty-acyl-phospholipid synthase